MEKLPIYREMLLQIASNSTKRDSLTLKMFFIRKEIELTNFIINIIEKESVIDIRENVIKLIKDDNDGESS